MRANTSRAMSSKKGLEVVDAHQAQVDPIGHLEAGPLAQVLDVADELADEPPAAQVVVEGEVEGHHLGSVAGDGKAGLGPHPQLDLVAGQLDRPVGQLHHHRESGGQRLRRRRRRPPCPWPPEAAGPGHPAGARGACKLGTSS